VNLREVMRRLDLVQRSRGFKIAATVVVVLAAGGLFLAYWLAATAPAEDGLSRLEQLRAAEALAFEEMRREQQDQARTGGGGPAVEVEGPDSAIEEGRRALENVLRGRSDPTGVASGLAIGAGLAVAVIWMGLGLTYLGLALAAALIAYPLSRFEGTGGIAVLVAGAVALTASFTALMQAARAAMSPGNAVTAVARNVLAEAVRLRLSVVFIVLLIFGLSALPNLLDEGEALRYRVQSFLQYGTSGSYWIVALLTVFFSTATVAFEQRDKTIWQTVTKPVSAWQYILGKWLGIVTLNAVLLAVCGSGVFLFTEYLRSQPAQGERSAFVPVSEASMITSDRLILETQVLAARVTVRPQLPFRFDNPDFQRSAIEFIETQRMSDPQFARTPEEQVRVMRELYDTSIREQFTIEPGQARRFVFEGLERARAEGRPLALRLRVDVGINRPDEFHYVTLGFPEVGQLQVREVAPGFGQVLPPLTPSLIGSDGRLVVEVFNGDLQRGMLSPRPGTMSIPRQGGLEVSFEAGSYRANFARVVGVLWLKLAFIAMVGVCAATFLSFPVAAMVTLGTFLAAEGASFILSSIELYGTVDYRGETAWHKLITVSIATPIARAFEVYAELSPTQRLVDGQFLSWASVMIGTVVIGLWTVMLYVVGVLIFRRRELATYSGR